MKNFHLQIFRVFYVVCFLTILSVLFSKIAPQTKAQVQPTANCTVTGNVRLEDGSGSIVRADQIPEWTPFSIKIQCNNITQRGTFQASINGETKPPYPGITGGPGSLTEFFGVFSGFPGDPSGRKSYSVSTIYFIPGMGSGTAPCTDGSGSPCAIIIQGAGAPPPPSPSPTPLLNCPSFRSYNPINPQVGQELQLQFSIPAGGNINDYTVNWSAHSGSGILHLVDASVYGVWVANFGVVNEETNWSLIQVVAGTTRTCTQNQFLTGVGPGASGAPGHNPCGPNGENCPTALGNIPTDPAQFIQRILAIAIGLAGGIALILMVIGSIRVLTSSGDQQKLAGGRDMIVAAITGLLFLILSVVILRFIGVNIIGL